MKGTWETTGGGWDWRWAAVVAVIAVIAVSGGASGLFSGIETALVWVAAVLTVAAVAVSVIVWRKTRAISGLGYVRSVHGPSQRDLEIDRMQEIRREIIETRATRLEIERQKLIEAAMRQYSVPPGTETGMLTRIEPDYIQHGTVTGWIPREDA